LRSARARGDDGAGLIGTIAGVVVFLMFLLFAVQLLFGLYATSTVTATAYDTAQRAASRGADRSADALELYAADGRQALGRMGDTATFTWELDDTDADGTPDTVVLDVAATPPRFVPRSVGGMIGFEEVRRTVRVRIEAFQR
jgi:hypothetical protein